MRRGRLITIGSFDGVHLGHQALIARTVLEAKKRALKSMALTFSVPPKMVLNPAAFPRLLSDAVEKETLLKLHGIDEVKVLNFSRKIAGLKPFAFFRDILIRSLNAKGVVIGADFRFGKERSAGALELVRWGGEFEIPVWVIPPVKIHRQIVSSSLIRRYLEGNYYRQALNYLGHPYLVQGRVVQGRHLGRKLGFPTANLQVAKGKILPRGVFAVRGTIKNCRTPSFEGVCNIGSRPTVSHTSKMVLEVHIFGETPSLVGKTIQVELVHRLRGEKKFKSLDQLKRAIASDVYQAKALLS
ncbi:MAG: Riboflavin biosynthesis protein RibF [Elusimicrobia bacterium]|nr:Riboflavin biosynthesis protein RibF [Elusimicrobiota bacterium]